MYCYPSALLAGLFGENAFSYRLLAAAAGTAFIAIFFLIVRRMFSLWVSLGATALLSFSYISIAWAREARWYTLFELFFWLSLWTFWELMQSRGKHTRTTLLWALATLASTVLAVLTHELGVLLPIIFALWAALDRYVLTRAGSAREAVLVAGLVVIITLLALLSLSTLPAWLLRFDFYNTLIFYVTYLIGTYWPLLVVALPGIILTSKTDKRALWFLLFAGAAYLIPLALLNPVIHYRYLFHLTPILFVAATFGMSVLFEHVKDKLARIAALAAVLAACIASSVIILLPQPFYFLETDKGIWFPGRAYSAATPQPDWNAAYAYIKENRAAEDIVISSLPVMTKIYLGEPGFWLPYSYLGLPSPADEIQNGKEGYVGADAIETREELEALMTTKRGFVIFDRMAASARVDAALLTYVTSRGKLVFLDKKGSYSEIWVYSF